MSPVNPVLRQDPSAARTARAAGLPLTALTANSRVLSLPRELPILLARVGEDAGLSSSPYRGPLPDGASRIPLGLGNTLSRPPDFQEEMSDYP